MKRNCKNTNQRLELSRSVHKRLGCSLTKEFQVRFIHRIFTLKISITSASPREHWMNCVCGVGYFLVIHSLIWGVAIQWKCKTEILLDIGTSLFRAHFTVSHVNFFCLSCFSLSLSSFILTVLYPEMAA